MEEMQSLRYGFKSIDDRYNDWTPLRNQVVNFLSQISGVATRYIDMV